MAYKGETIGLALIVDLSSPTDVDSIVESIKKFDFDSVDKFVVMDMGKVLPISEVTDDISQTGRLYLIELSEYLVKKKILFQLLENVDQSDFNQAIKSLSSFDSVFCVSQNIFFRDSWLSKYMDIITGTSYKTVGFNWFGVGKKVEENGIKVLLSKEYSDDLMGFGANTVNILGGVNKELFDIGYGLRDFGDRAVRAGISNGVADFEGSKSSISFVEKPAQIDDEEYYEKSKDIIKRRNIHDLYESLGESNPDISVIMGTMNRPETLLIALTSVMKQKVPSASFEVVIVNDGGEDVAAILKKYFPRDFGNKIRYLNLTHNVGRAEARNRGIKVARGKYLMFFDDDDYLSSDSLEKLYSAIKKSGHQNAMSSGHTYTYHLAGINKGHGRIESRATEFKAHPYASFGPVSTGSALWPREVIMKVGMFDPSLPTNEDSDLWGRALNIVDKAIHIQSTVLNYMFHAPAQYRQAYEKPSGRSEWDWAIPMMAMKYRSDPDFIKKMWLKEDNSFIGEYIQNVERGNFPPMSPDVLHDSEVVRISLTPIDTPIINIKDGFEEVKIIEKQGEDYLVERTNGERKIVIYNRIVGTFQGFFPERADDVGKVQTEFTVGKMKFAEFLGADGPAKLKALKEKDEKSKDKEKVGREKAAVMEEALVTFYDRVNVECGMDIPLTDLMDLQKSKHSGSFRSARRSSMKEIVAKTNMLPSPDEFLKKYEGTRVKKFKTDIMHGLEKGRMGIVGKPEEIQFNTKKYVKGVGEFELTGKLPPKILDKDEEEIIDDDTQDIVKLMNKIWRRARLPISMAGKKFLHINGRWGELALEAARRGATYSYIAQLEWEAKLPRFKEILGQYGLKETDIKVFDTILMSAITSNINVFRKPMDVVVITMEYITVIQKIRALREPKNDEPLWVWLADIITKGGMLYVEAGGIYRSRTFFTALKDVLISLGFMYVETTWMFDPVKPTERNRLYIFTKDRRK